MKYSKFKGLQGALLLAVLLFTVGFGHGTVYAAAPSNDLFGNATIVNLLTYTNSINTTQATVSATDPDPIGLCTDGYSLAAGNKTVWYTYQPSVQESIQVDTNGTNYDTYIAVFTGTEGALSLVKCNDDDLVGYTSRLSFIGNAGTQYYIQIGEFRCKVSDCTSPSPPVGGNLTVNINITNVDVTIGNALMGSYYIQHQNEFREYYDVTDGPVKVESTSSFTNIAAIRLQSLTNGNLYSFVETMGVPDGLLSYKYYFPTYNNTWAPLNSQLRFANINNTSITVRVTIGTQHWDYGVPANSERREYLNVSDGPVIIESLDPTKKIIAAIRLQSKPGPTLFSFSETMGVPAEQLSYRYYFPTYNNTWAPLNSQLRFGNLNDTAITVRVTIGTQHWDYPVSAHSERREYLNVSDGPVIIESLDPTKDIIAAIRLQSKPGPTLYSFVETMGVPDGLLSYKYYFPTYNNTWALLNSQLRFANLNNTAITVRVTIGAQHWDYVVPANSERREYRSVSDGPVIIESLDPTKKIIAAIRLQSKPGPILYSFSETMGIPAEQLSTTNYFPTYNNVWTPLNSQLRFAVP